MKLFKKTAALLFCLALVFSVMAISASADDEAQLLDTTATGVPTVVNNNYQVKLSRTARDSSFNTGIYDRDNVTGVEINATQDVTFDITLFYTGTETSPSIDGFQFDYDPADNDGATIAVEDTVAQAFVIKADSANPTAMLNSSKTYGYSAGGNSADDITVPASTVTNGRVIGRITVSFDSATPNKAIYPKIKNLQITLRNDDDTIQQPVAATASAPSDNDSSGNGVVSSGITTNPGVLTTPGGTETTNGCIIVATEPVYVNPVYTVTLESYAADGTTGIIAKQDSSKDSTLKYDFTNGSFVKSGGNSDTEADYTYTSGSDTFKTILANTPVIDGYTLQGWMVTNVDITTNDVPDSAQITWAAYDSTNLTNAWNTNGSYPATTVRDSYVVGTNPTWNNDVWSGASSTLKVVSGLGINFISANTSTSVTNDQPVVGYTVFPKQMVGDITLTPVYTRNVYVATFDSGAVKASFASAPSAVTDYITAPARVSGDNSNYQYTKTYTIEDLYDATKATEQGTNYPGYEDFLELDDTNNNVIADAAKGPQGLTRTAFKFMGWTVSNTDAATVTDAYEWVVKQDSDTVDGTDDFLVKGSCNHYGDVVFTAQWEEDVYFAKIDYQYAGTGNALILVGVPADATNTRNNYDANYTYKCKGVEMYRVPKFLSDKKVEVESGTACAQRTEYVKAALDSTLANKNPTTANAPEKGFYTTFTTDIFGENGAGKEYVIFAYISVVKTATQTEHDTDVTDITITESTSTSNTALAYDGDVDESGLVNVGDFGNVDTLLGDMNKSSVFSITGDNGKYGVRARLQADVTTETDDSDSTIITAGLVGFGSIKDVKTIYEKLGYNPSAS